MIDSPKLKDENLFYRASLISDADNDKQLQAAIYEQCKKDILYWINAYCWIYEPRQEQYKQLGFDTPHLPFITWDYQDETILWVKNKIESGEDGLIEKSRDMGVSWIVLTVLLWFWNFDGPGNDFLIGSRKEVYVDKQGAMDALFPKLRYQLRRQPGWLLPKGFDLKKHSTYLFLTNPETGSYIKGESNNKFFSTSGRYKGIFFDEFAKWEHTDETAYQSASDATKCKLTVSSAFGKNNMFYKLRAKVVGVVEKLRLHWNSHPLKDEIWYAAEKLRRSKEDLAAEVDIDYTASITGKAYGSFKYDIHCVKPYPEHNTNLPIALECDFNITPMSWAISHEIHGEDFYFDEIVEQTRTETEFAAIRFRNRYSNHKCKELNLYGDPSGKYGSTKSLRSDYAIISSILEKDGWQISQYVRSAHPSIKDRINAMNKRLCDWATKDNKNWVHVNPMKCPTIVDSFEQTQRKGDGIDKSDNIEHITDGISYKQEYKYPIRNDYVGYREL